MQSGRAKYKKEIKNSFFSKDKILFAPVRLHLIWGFFISMTTSFKTRYRILSFITLIKIERDNSIIDKLTVETTFANKIGISYNSYKKYFRTCLQLGLIKEYKGHYKVIGLVDAIEALGLSDTINKHNRFFKGVEYKQITFNNVYNKIVDGILLKNYKQQQYKVEKDIKKYHTAKLILNNSHLVTKKTKAQAKQLEIEARANGKGLVSHLNSIVSSKKNCSVVSGKYHAANLLGMSTSSGSNRITKLVKNGLITREVVKRVYNTEYTNAGYDYIRSVSNSFIAPSSFLNRFIEFKGSRIGLL